MNDRSEWRMMRAGKITASRLDDICTASGKWTQASMSYLYQLQRERILGAPMPEVSSKAMEWGNEQEPYAVDWLRHNMPEEYRGMKVRHYDVDFESKVFVSTDYGYGCSPDADIYDGESIRALVEIKSPYRSVELCTIFSPTMPYELKKERVKKEHGMQLAGQLLLYPEVEKILLLKYDGQDDDDDNDMRSPLDPSRGILFEFRRDEFDLEGIEERIRFADRVLSEGLDIEEINELWKKRTS